MSRLEGVHGVHSNITGDMGIGRKRFFDGWAEEFAKSKFPGWHGDEKRRRAGKQGRKWEERWKKF